MSFIDLVLIFTCMGCIAGVLGLGLTLISLFALVTGNKQLLKDLNW